MIFVARAHQDRFVVILDDEYEIFANEEDAEKYARQLSEDWGAKILDLTRSLPASEPEEYESYGPDDLSDDGDALASAGWGTDEDYGYYGGDEY